MSYLETYTLEPVSEEMTRREKRMMRRKRYDRVRVPSSNAGFAVRVPRKLKVAKLDSRPRALNRVEEDAPALSWVWENLGDEYVASIVDDAVERDWTLVPFRPPKSHLNPEAEQKISFTLSVLEDSYEEHLKNAFGGRYR